MKVMVGRRELLDLASMGFLGLAGNSRIAQACEATIEKYGCGSCGPRGFYGTIDVHLDLEERFAEFMGFPQAILYSFDIATPPRKGPGDSSDVEHRGDFSAENLGLLVVPFPAQPGAVR